MCWDDHCNAANLLSSPDNPQSGPPLPSRSLALVPQNHHLAFILLWLPESSSCWRIKEAYRQLALKHHPDHVGTHGMMVALNRAYQLALAYAKATPAA